ncbi:NHS-like protein 3 isoform X2 [Paralichthys olivaceus]|uniref:NHS-like protein 3 isoform X2 n=1 Tax=Paralichthys olivaceus TaxID=8255 RepID=UPI0037507086
MSNRDSLGFGELLPQDVVQIFAQEKHSKRGHKKRSHSLGRALGWLQRKKRKGLGPNGRNLGLGPALDLALVGHPSAQQGGDKGGQRSGRHTHPHGNSHAVPKRDDDDKTPAPPLLQENVFIEASRPKYLEDLHTEALEGLKMMQHEETNYGVEYQDNESTISTMTVQTDGEGGGFMTDSTIADTSSIVSVQSSVSTRSSRSGLTRQGSTFRPLKSEKTRRRRHRKTVVGIPQHVQREMGLDRVGWTLAQKLDEEPLYNGETDDSPTTDGPQQTSESQKNRAGLQDKKIIHPLNKDQIKQLNATHAGHRDDLALLHRLGPNLSDGQRPRSLAVPWMTTANSLQPEPPSPVMSMSPQAAYMSKIIPNAVLPPSIEVVEISRGRSRNSLRTVSKSSLLLSSPAPSRASSRASSSRTTSSRSSTITSASRQNPLNLSDSSCWSNSDSSETLVSDSSTISSSSTPRQKSQDGDASAKEGKIIKTFKYNYNGVLTGKAEAAKKEGPFVRSLSVMKSKKAPTPPSRSYSLHSKMKRRSRDLAEVRVIPGESSLHRISTTVEENEKNNSGPSPMSPRIIDSPGYNADTSSLDDSTGSFSPIRSQALKAEEAVKVDSSQEKQDPPKENKPSKIISPSSGYSSQDAISPQLPKQPHSSSPKHKRGILAKLQKLFPGSTSAGSAPSPLTQSENPENTKHNKMDSVDTVGVSASVRTLRELFNIPPPPKVHAPPPPPPEVWAHSKRSFELLLGPPAPDNIYAIIKKNPKDRRQQRQPPSASTDGSVKSLEVERKHMNPAVTVESINGSIERRKVQESLILNAEIHKEMNERLAQNVDLKGNVKVTEKAKVSDIINVMLVKAVEKREERMKSEANDKSTETTEVKTNMDTLPAISLARISPFPSPAVLHHSPQPHTKQSTEVTSVTSVRAVVSPESSWPPPPPPITQVGVSGPDELDFPLPPPLFGDAGFVIPVQVPPERSTPDGDSSATTSVVTLVMTEAETQKSSSSEGIAPPPLNIPPPPPYTAPPPPIKSVSPTTIKKACLPPREIFLPPPKEFSPLPQIKEVSPPPPKEVSPPPPPKEVSPPPPKEVSPPPPKEVSPPPTKEVSPPPPKEVSLPPPKESSSPPPKESSPPPSKEVSPPAPKEVSPPPPKDVSPPPPKEVSPSAPEEVSPPKQSPPLLVKHVPPPLVIKVPPSTEILTPSTEKVVLLSSQESVSQSSVEETLVCKLNPPQSIPPPPPLQLKPHLSDIDLPQEDILPEIKTNQASLSSTLAPPESIPPLPPIEQPQALAGPTTHEVPPSEVSIPQSLETSPSPEKPQEQAPSPSVNIPLPPPLPVQGLTTIKLQSSTVSTETPSQELTPSNVVQEESTLLVTPSLLQMVKLRSVNSSPEPPKAQEDPKAEVTMRKQQPSDQVPTSSVNGEAPQKPIRRSLIVTSPTSTSPPVNVTSEPALPKLQPLVAPPASSSPVPSPTKKSPPATTASPSMKLQEAIRLRTAARSKESPASRLSLQPPTSPIDLQRSPKSPTSTASFIFSKSNKKVVIETKPVPEAKAKVQNKLEVSSVTKVVSEPESLKTTSKVPPPVAKKPKSKTKENETSEGMEQTAGQEAQRESIHDGAEKTNGTAGAAEAGETPST